MVPTEGVEPTHPHGYQILSLARLPIPPHRPPAHQYILSSREVNKFRRKNKRRPEIFQTGIRTKLAARSETNGDRVPCLVISFSPSQTARPLLGSVSESWKL